MTWTLQIRKCGSSDIETIRAFSGEISCDYDNQLERFTFVVDYNIEGELTGEDGFIGGEWNSDVLLKNGSEVTLYFGTEIWFFGYIYTAPKEVTAENRVITYTAYCPKYRLRKAQVPYGGYISWGLESPKLKFTEVYLQIATGYNIGESRTYFIPYTQGVHFDNATYLGVNDTLSADGGATISLSANNQGFAPRGFVLVDRIGIPEIVYYDGYFFDGAVYRLYNCVRTQLGTVGGPHLAGVTVEQLVYKEITRDAELLELQRVGYDYDRIPYSRFTKNFKLGGFTFNQEQDGNVRGTYQIYDETASDVVLLEDIFTIFCTADRDNGGAGFAVGELDFDALNIAVNLYQYDLRFYNGYALDLLNRLVDELQLNILFYWSSSEDRLRLAFVTQNAVPDITLTQVASANRDEDFDELYTDVRVIYEDEDNFSSLDPEYFWHTKPYTQRSGDWRDRNRFAPRPAVWYDFGNTYDDDSFIRVIGVKERIDNLKGITDDDRFAAVWNSWGGRNVMDQSSSSTLTAWWNPKFVDYDEIFDSAHEWHHTYYWFSADAEVRTLDEIRIQIGDQRLGQAIVTVYGASNYDPATMSPSNVNIEWYEVSPELTRVGGISGDSEASFTFSTTNFTQPAVNILRITFHEIPSDRDGFYIAAIQEFFVRAGKTKTLLVSLTNNITHVNDPEYVYDPTAYNRLSCIRPVVDKLEIGKASDQEALYLGRQRLIEALTYYYNRSYVYDRPWTDRKPRIGDTIRTQDLQGLYFDGVLIDYLISFQSGNQNFNMAYTVFNYDAEVIGG